MVELCSSSSTRRGVARLRDWLPGEALLFGIDAYDAPELKPTGAAQDARNMGALLKDTWGFDCFVVENPNEETLTNSLDAWLERLECAAKSMPSITNLLTVLFYAGHSYNNQESELPTLMAKEHDINSLQCGVRLDAVMDRLAKIRLRGDTSLLAMVIMDSCRCDGFMASACSLKSSPGIDRWKKKTSRNQFLFFLAADPSDVARAHQGRGGYFTEALLRHLANPFATLDDLYNRVYEDVHEQSSHFQRPWYYKRGDYFSRVRLCEAPAWVKATVERCVGDIPDGTLDLIQAGGMATWIWLQKKGMLKTIVSKKCGQIFHAIFFMRTPRQEEAIRDICDEKAVYEKIRHGGPWSEVMLEDGRDLLAAKYETYFQGVVAYLQEDWTYNAQDPNLEVVWVIYTDSGAVVGRGGLQPEGATPRREAMTEPFVAIKEAYWGNGIATQFFEEHLIPFYDQVTQHAPMRILCMECNPASIKIAGRSFQWVARFPHGEWDGVNYEVYERSLVTQSRRDMD